MLAGQPGLWLSRPLLWKLLSGTALCLKPLVSLLLKEILQGVVAQADETPVRHLGGELGKSLLGYLFGYADDDEHRFQYCDFRPNRSCEEYTAAIGPFSQRAADRRSFGL